MKILSVGTESFHTDGQTDRHDEANSSFSHLKKSYNWIQCFVYRKPFVRLKPKSLSTVRILGKTNQVKFLPLGENPILPVAMTIGNPNAWGSQW